MVLEAAVIRGENVVCGIVNNAQLSRHLQS
jgi:hypothetical protein